MFCFHLIVTTKRESSIYIYYIEFFLVEIVLIEEISILLTIVYLWVQMVENCSIFAW